MESALGEALRGCSGGGRGRRGFSLRGFLVGLVRMLQGRKWWWCLLWWEVEGEKVG